MSVSVIDPLGPAMNRTQRVLFQPFDFGKWLRLGLCAFLASLGEGGSSFNGNSNSGGGGQGGGGPNMNDVGNFLEEYALILAIAVVVVVLLFIGLGLLVQWLSSRGKFMFLDGVVKNRGAVVEPWKEYRTEGNSLFFFRVVLGILGFVLFLVLAGVCLLIAWPDIQAEQFGSMATFAIVAGITGIFVYVLTMAVIGVFLEDFVIPIMYLRRIRAMEAWRVFGNEIWAENVGVLLLYLLAKFLIGLVVGVIAMMAVCLTCCLAALPYVGSVVLLPLTVFVRCYSLYFLQQFGPMWQIMPDGEVPPKPLDPYPYK